MSPAVRSGCGAFAIHLVIGDVLKRLAKRDALAASGYGTWGFTTKRLVRQIVSCLKPNDDT